MYLFAYKKKLFFYKQIITLFYFLINESYLKTYHPFKYLSFMIYIPYLSNEFVDICLFGSENTDNIGLFCSVNDTILGWLIRDLEDIDVGKEDLATAIAGEPEFLEKLFFFPLVPFKHFSVSTQDFVARETTYRDHVVRVVFFVVWIPDRKRETRPHFF